MNTCQPCLWSKLLLFIRLICLLKADWNLVWVTVPATVTPIGIEVLKVFKPIPNVYSRGRLQMQAQQTEVLYLPCSTYQQNVNYVLWCYFLMSLFSNTNKNINLSVLCILKITSWINGLHIVYNVAIVLFHTDVHYICGVNSPFPIYSGAQLIAL